MEKKKLRKFNFEEIMKNYFLSLLIILFFLIILLVLVSIPHEKRGRNLEPLDVEFTFYIVNQEIDIISLERYIGEANEIWKKYNISILVKEIVNVQINLTDEERHMLYTNISHMNAPEENQRICEEDYLPLIKQITDNSPDMSIIFLGGTRNKGRGSLCGHSFAIFDKEKYSFRDLTSWNLAHEIGHVLGLIHPESRFKLNLMIDTHKLFWKSGFLNQEQVNTVERTIASKE
jgi:hypothetical protein